MHATSRSSLAVARERFYPVVAAAGEDAYGLALQLAEVIDVLDGSAPLRRALTDPALGAEAKAALVTEVFQTYDPRVRQVLTDLCAGRWSAEADLPDAVEELGIVAAMADAEARGVLAGVEEELARVSAAVDDHRELRALLDRHGAEGQAAAVMEELLAGHADRFTAALARRAILHPRGRRLVPTLRTVEAWIAERRAQLIANVTSAVALSPAQLQRLDSALERAYGCAVTVYVNVDPAVVGGIRLQVGPDVIDATVLSKVAEARRYLAA